MLKIIPNTLTIIRVLLIPVLIAGFYFDSKFSHYLVVCIFIFASITDYFDGFLARIWKVQSNFGKVLDPIADKMMIAATLMMMVDHDIAPVLPSVVILCREILVSGMREYLAELKIKISVPVSFLGKVKTATQMVAIIILLIVEDISGSQYFDIIGRLVLWFSAGLTVITGYSYLRGGIKHFK